MIPDFWRSILALHYVLPEPSRSLWVPWTPDRLYSLEKKKKKTKNFIYFYCEYFQNTIDVPTLVDAFVRNSVINARIYKSTWYCADFGPLSI